MNAEEQRGLDPLPIDVDVVQPREVAAVLDLEPVLVERPTLLVVLVRGERVANELELLAVGELHLELERSDAR